MSRLVFVSYNFRHDRATARNVGQLFQSGGGTCDGRPVFVEHDVSGGGDAAIDREIRRVMAPCSAAIFVVGDDSHNSPWLEREAEIATSMNLRIAAVQASGTEGGAPKVLRDRGIEPYAWADPAMCTYLNGGSPSRT